MPLTFRYLLLFFLSGILLLNPGPALAQNTSAQDNNEAEQAGINRARLSGVIIGSTTIYAATLGGLYLAWYKNNPQSSFHFHDDLHDWLQMDKGGHMVSSYYFGMLSYESLRWAGVDKKRATWYGGLMGSVLLTTIEILDGFSAEWGASVSDLAANTMGSAMFISQQLAWDEQHILLKYSYHPTRFAGYRPDVLGSSHMERMIKDYNGMTFWLSANPNSFGFENIPAWLNIAVGYGATGMTGGSENISGYHQGRFIPEYQRTRQFYLSLDIDLSRIETRSTAMNMVLKALNVVKIPFPALELNSNKKFRFHPLYF
jgi:hypothetical protein